jgi:DNA polymerase III epsilon subunit-like protein
MTIVRDKVLILDTETTSVTAKDEVIELAYIQCPLNLREWVQDYTNYSQVQDTEMMGFVVSSKEVYNEQFKPSVPISPHAHKVHGLSMLKLLGKRPSKEITLPKDIKYMCGHNALFDYRMLGKPEGVLLIDTLVIIRILRKLGLLTNDNVEGKDKLDVLIAHYYPEISKNLIKPLHAALDDCYKVILLLNKILELLPNISTWEDLYNLQPKKK